MIQVDTGICYSELSQNTYPPERSFDRIMSRPVITLKARDTVVFAVIVNKNGVMRRKTAKALVIKIYFSLLRQILIYYVAHALDYMISSEPFENQVMWQQPCSMSFNFA
jgi:hypothetical protein